ncbi:MAG: UMP kinase [bacterium]
MKNTAIISLGGSVIVPDKINVDFLKSFKNLISHKINKGKRFFIITGGGNTCRLYIKGAKEISGISRDDLDWLGIHSTVLNAHLLRTIFRKDAYKRIINDPRDMKDKFKEKIIIASGWSPGWSTDYIAAKIAEKYGIKKIINISNINYVYDKDPKKFKNARPLDKICWKNFRKIVGNKWDPGLNMPFDPIASKLAQKNQMKINIINGKNIENLEKCIDDKPFKGTIIY